MPPDRLSESIKGRRRASQDGFVVQIAMHVRSQRRCRFVAVIAILLQGFHDDPIEFTMYHSGEASMLDTSVHRDDYRFLRRMIQPAARSGRIDFANDPQGLVNRRFLKSALR